MIRRDKDKEKSHIQQAVAVAASPMPQLERPARRMSPQHRVMWQLHTWDSGLPGSEGVFHMHDSSS